VLPVSQCTTNLHEHYTFIANTRTDDWVFCGRLGLEKLKRKDLEIA